MSSAPVYQSYAWDDAVRLLAGCKVLKVPQLPAISDKPVASDLPVLLFNGGLDPATAPDYGARIAKVLPNSQNILFPAAGHGQAQNVCAMSILQAFAKNPKAKVDTSCIPPKVIFVPIDASATSTDGKAKITMTLPPGFVSAPGQWLFGTGVVALAAYPAGTTAEGALESMLKQLNIPLDAAAGQRCRPYRRSAGQDGQRQCDTWWHPVWLRFLCPCEQGRRVRGHLLAKQPVHPGRAGASRSCRRC